MRIKRYRKKPVVIDAVRLTEADIDPIAFWCGGEARSEVSPRDHDDVYRYILIPTLEGVMKAEIGDWVVKGVKGEFYPVKNDIFKATYEEGTE